MSVKLVAEGFVTSLVWTQTEGYRCQRVFDFVSEGHSGGLAVIDRDLVERNQVWGCLFGLVGGLKVRVCQPYLGQGSQECQGGDLRWMQTERELGPLRAF